SRALIYFHWNRTVLRAYFGVKIWTISFANPPPRFFRADYLHPASTVMVPSRGRPVGGGDKQSSRGGVGATAPAISPLYNHELTARPDVFRKSPGQELTISEKKRFGS